MNAKMKVNFVEKTIEVTQSFASKAACYGSEEYRALLAATTDLPGFKVTTKTVCRQHRTYSKGLTYEYMESYISMADKEGTLLEEFSFMRQVYGYAVTKKWFMNKFPEPFKFAA